MAEEKPTTYITDEERAQLGVERPGTSSPPVAAGDIRKWAIAVYWPERPPALFWDQEHAKKTRWGGIVAPQEFNPFTWPAERPKNRPSAMGTGQPGTRILNGGAETEYFVPIRPGDVITSSSKLAEVYERQGRMGLMKFVVTQTDWKNQRGELVRINKNTLIYY
ncbi:MAG: MaoC family dehydratase N-terminal domain-containing protein [Chloroflexi bacterium]|nr:MaoC family dehydratase N-terminal domain-containing protein [Chloroflexota bacterium]